MLLVLWLHRQTVANKIVVSNGKHYQARPRPCVAECTARAAANPDGLTGLTTDAQRRVQIGEQAPRYLQVPAHDAGHAANFLGRYRSACSMRQHREQAASRAAFSAASPLSRRIVIIRFRTKWNDNGFIYWQL